MSQSYHPETRANLSGQPQQTQSRQFDVPNLERLSLLAMFAIVGQVILLASSWLLPFVSEYSLMGDNISEMVLGRYGFVQTAAFVIAGLGTLGLAYVIRQLTVGVRGSIAGSLLVAVYGLGAVLVAVFPTDRIDSPADVWTQSTTGMIHIAVSAISFLCMVIGMFVLSWAFARAARWRSLMLGSVLLAGSALALFIVQGEGPIVGLLQRAMVTVISAWIILVALRVRAIVVDQRGVSRGTPSVAGGLPGRDNRQ